MPGGAAMKQRSFIWTGLLLSLLLPLVIGCAGGSAQKLSTSIPAARQTGEVLYILDHYTQRARHIVALPVGTMDPVARLTLPAGLSDLEHHRLYIANPLTDSKGNVHTTISIIDTSSGAPIRTFNIQGSYST